MSNSSMNTCLNKVKEFWELFLSLGLREEWNYPLFTYYLYIKTNQTIKPKTCNGRSQTDLILCCESTGKCAAFELKKNNKSEENKKIENSSEILKNKKNKKDKKIKLYKASGAKGNYFLILDDALNELNEYFLNLQSETPDDDIYYIYIVKVGGEYFNIDGDILGQTLKNALACSPEIEAYILITSESLNDFTLLFLEERELLRETSVIVEKVEKIDKNEWKIEEQEGTLYIYKVKIRKKVGLEQIINKIQSDLCNLDN